MGEGVLDRREKGHLHVGCLTRLVYRWADVEATLLDRAPGPWFMAVNETVDSEISLWQAARSRLRSRPF
jgi:hypothetical protein